MVCLLQPTFGLYPQATSNSYLSCNSRERLPIGEFPASLSSDLGVAMGTLQISFPALQKLSVNGWVRAGLGIELPGPDLRMKNKHLPRTKNLPYLCLNL